MLRWNHRIAAARRVRGWHTVWLVGLVAVSRAGAAQSATELVARGDSIGPLLHPDSALVYYRLALAQDSGSYEALWRTGRGYVDIARQIQARDDSSRRVRDSLYLLGSDYGYRAIRADSTAPDGHFVVALALGRLSRERGGREKVRYARIVYDEAATTLRIRPDHDGAHHILGAWHWEASKLSGANRFLAKAFLGGGFLNIAKRDSAVAHLERSVELNPGYLYHRIALAELYRRLKRYPDAVAQLEALPGLPDGDVQDPFFRAVARGWLQELKTAGR